MFWKRNKWELVQENAPYVQVTTNPILGVVSQGAVLCDVYRKKKRDGTYKYKKVKR